MKQIITIISFFLFLSVFTLGQIINVPDDQPTIQAAIDVSVDGDTVLVADGTYYETIDYKGKAVTVASWFLVDGDETHIDSTIINGSQAPNGSVVDFSSGEDTTSVLYGFTITGGKGSNDPHGYGAIGGGGIAINSGGKIQYNKIIGNFISDDIAVGGGIVIDSPVNHALILNNYIADNKLVSPQVNNEGGGGILCYNSTQERIIIAENIISNNIIVTALGSLTGRGGGIFLKESKALLRNNLIKNNKAGQGGGICLDEYPSNVSPVFINNTIINNESLFSGGGIYVYSSGATPKIINSIVWGNTSSNSSQITSNVLVEYSDVEGGFTGKGNIDQEPLFTDTTLYHLDPLSHCVDAGFPLSIYFDVEDPNNPGSPLLPSMGGLRNDMGCYGGNPRMMNASLPESIAALKVDSDTNYVPDRLNEEVTTTGVVSSINFQKSSGNLGFYIYSLEAGIFVFVDNDDTTDFEIGDWVEVHGTIDQYAGLTEIVVANTETDIVLLEHNHPQISQTVYIDELLNNPEKYEGMFVRVNALKKSLGEWPTSNVSLNLDVTDGYKSISLRLDDDTDLGSNPEPVYPMDLKGIVSQYSFTEPANDSYQLLVNTYDDIEQNVEAAPSPYFFFTPDSKDNENGDYGITEPSSFRATLSWYPAVDLNNDNLTYQFAIIRKSDGEIVSEGPSDLNGASTHSSITNAQIIDFIQEHGENNSFTGSWVIRVTDGNTGMIASVDTLKNFTLNDLYTPTAVDDENTLPKEFALNQNYPNPFNPSTTISYSIPNVASGFSLSNVTLKVYDMLGREIKTLINKNQKPGFYEVSWDASNQSSGIYFYQLQADSFNETRKMILLR